MTVPVIGIGFGIPQSMGAIVALANDEASALELEQGGTLELEQGGSLELESP